jgi:IS30 family transposase
MGVDAGIGRVVRTRLPVRRMRRPKASKLAVCPRLRAVVEAKLEARWSPQQISGWLVEEFARCSDVLDGA